MTQPKHLQLVVLSDTFAVCRLSPDAAVPQWATRAAASFCSITRTAEELSIVCPQQWVPPSAENNNTINVQSNWTCFKIQGPLEFAWTGILASLASPLSEAGISIFAISTYDTDFLLVKCEQAQEAAAVFRQQGHAVTYDEPKTKEEEEEEEETTTTARIVVQPMDGPATEFVADSWVASLLRKKSSHPDSDTALLGGVVVAGWPPQREQWLRNYAGFRAAVELCFDETDVTVPFGRTEDESPAVYFYPFAAMHTTVATFRPFTCQNLLLSEQQQESMMETWTQILERATQHELWPKQALRLEIESAQLGSKAGILLWNETTGGLEAMRNCINQALHDFVDKFPQDTASMKSTFTIPRIIHSTFCRFYHVPVTKCATVQERFQRNVVANLSSFFPSSIDVDSVSLVCERRPYMHIPNDEQHVLWHLELKE